MKKEKFHEKGRDQQENGFLRMVVRPEILKIYEI